MRDEEKGQLGAATGQGEGRLFAPQRCPKCGSRLVPMPAGPCLTDLFCVDCKRFPNQPDPKQVQRDILSRTLSEFQQKHMDHLVHVLDAKRIEMDTLKAENQRLRDWITANPLPWYARVIRWLNPFKRFS